MNNKEVSYGDAVTQLKILEKIQIRDKHRLTIVDHADERRIQINLHLRSKHINLLLTIIKLNKKAKKNHYLLNKK